MIVRQLFEPVSCSYSYLIASRRGQGDKVSTIGDEKAFNSLLQVKSVDKYVALMDGLNLADFILHEMADAMGKRLLFYCAFGDRSAMAAQDAAIASARHIQGGIDAWQKAGGALA